MAMGKKSNFKYDQPKVKPSILIIYLLLSAFEPNYTFFDIEYIYEKSVTFLITFVRLLLPSAVMLITLYICELCEASSSKKIICKHHKEIAFWALCNWPFQTALLRSTFAHTHKLHKSEFHTNIWSRASASNFLCMTQLG